MKYKYKVCVYAISKNEELFVDKWFNSVKDADYIVVLDTGSTDNTVDKLRKHGVYVVEKEINPWRFDVARNESLKLIPSDADNVCFGDSSDNVYGLLYFTYSNIWMKWQPWTNGSSTPMSAVEITQVDGYYEVDFGEELDGIGCYTDQSATTSTDVAPFEFEIYY